MEPFTAVTLREGDTVVVRGSGRADHANIGSFIEAMRQAFDTEATRIIVNLKDVGFLTSVGWGTLLTGATSAHKRGARLVLCELNGPVKSSYDLLSIHDTLRSFETEQEARASA